MNLIADSGSSKTDWRLISKGEVKQFECKGLNPDFQTEETVELELRSIFSDKMAIDVEQIFFYGSGCSSESRSAIIQKGLQAVFKNAQIEVEHDLLGAARASCGNEAGLAGILGTGSNCCLFDGTDVSREYRTGGYIIGDEGGGVSIGKGIIKAFIEDYLPKDLRDKFIRRYSLSVDDILENMYKKSSPNRFLASFSQFAFHHREHPFISDLIYDAFSEYFRKQVCRYPESKELRLNLVGSIAFYYQEIIRKVAQEFKVSVGRIVEKPISGLTLYHCSISD